MGFKKHSEFFNGVIGIVLSVFLIMSVAPVIAAEFPSKSVTLICPYTAGGVTDTILRVLAETTKNHLGQPIIIENKTGGGGTLGPAAMAATAKPDGYTVAQIPLPVLRFPYMMKTTWDPLKDFTYIMQITGYTFGVVVRADSPWKTWGEFVSYARANPGKITYSSSGVGTTPHLTMERIALKESVKWTYVPMKGGAESLAAVLGGHIDAQSEDTIWGPHVDAGTLRLLCTWGNQRTKKWPHVPTLKDLGYDIVSNSPWGLAGPKGIGPKVVKVLHDAFKKGMEEPTFQQALEKYNMEPFYKDPEEYAKYVRELCEKEKEIVEKLGLKKE